MTLIRGLRGHLMAAMLMLCATVQPLAGQGALLSAEQVAAAGEDLLVLDIRPAAEFARGHIPGAISIPWHSATWRATVWGVPEMAPDATQTARALGRAGISQTSAVVVVARGDSPASTARAARVFWLLRYLGHARLHLLDGGMAGWGADRPVVPGSIRRPPRTYLAAPDPSVLATVAHVEDAMSDNAPPIDARARAQYEGHETAPVVGVGGTILDAVNVPAAAMLRGTDTRFRAPGELAAIFARARAVTDRRKEVVFSDTGVRAAVVWFALHEVLRIDSARLYDGSMADWARQQNDIYDSTDGMGGVIGG